LTFSCQFTGKL